MTANRILTAYGSPWNTFLGYFMQETTLNSPLLLNNYNKNNNTSTLSKKPLQGVIWGKDSKHFEESRVTQLKSLLAAEPQLQLVSTANAVFQHRSVQWLGHQSAQQWMQLLAESKFLM